ncbi:MAG: hypothetical protein PUC64_05430 [Clostridium sp.]|nr:hypothetical protein [Clostridium sp.]
MIAYEEFISKLNERIKEDADFNFELLETVIKNPNRYTGIFRLSNARTKLIQNVTQSREIKFGDFMEGIITEYIRRMGYKNLEKNIGVDTDGNALSADQVFKQGNTIYLIEQKIRDDHDSTKKRGQYDNFRKKYTLLKTQNPNDTIEATMWFIDDSLIKNRNYYLSEAASSTAEGINIRILYGSELFSALFSRIDIWQEICSHLARNKSERSNEVLEIPDFDRSPEMLEALITLKRIRPRLYDKLLSDKPEYVQLRSELFNSGANINKSLAA